MLRGNVSNGPLLEVMRGHCQGIEGGIAPDRVDRLTDFEGAFSARAHQQTDALVVLDHAFFLANLNSIATLAAKHRLPSIGPLELATSGGLIAYGVNFAEQFRRAAVFVDKNSQGSKTGRHPGRAGDQVQDDCQPQDRQGDRHRVTDSNSTARRRGDRVVWRPRMHGLLHLLTAGYGPTGKRRSS